MADTQEGVFNFTTSTVLNHQNLFTPRAFKGKNGAEQGEPKYDLKLEISPDHADLPGLKAAAVAVARARWPGRDLKTEFQFPFASGDKLADKAKARGKDSERFRGKVILTARSQFEPRLAVAEKGSLVDYEGDRRPLAKPFFYNGVHVLAQINLVAYDGVGSNPDGVTAYINMVCSLNKGERLGSAAKPASEVFKGYAGTLSTEDPTASNVEDEIAY